MLASIKELYCHYFLFGQTLIDKIALKSGMADKYRYEFDNYDHCMEVLDRGKGAVMIGAHVGCWVAGTNFFAPNAKGINIVMYDAEHQDIKEVVEGSAQQQKNYNVISLNNDVVGAMLQIKVALNNGECICFTGDRYMEKEHTSCVDFLGAPALFPNGLFKIAAKCRVPVMFYFAMREPGCTYRLIFEEAVIEGKITHEALLQQYAK